MYIYQSVSKYSFIYLFIYLFIYIIRLPTTCRIIRNEIKPSFCI